MRGKVFIGTDIRDGPDNGMFRCSLLHSGIVAPSGEPCNTTILRANISDRVDSKAYSAPVTNEMFTVISNCT